MTILGTRPEIIRLSRVIELLDSLCEHVLVHSGQNYDANLSDLFFNELRVRKPDEFLGVRAASFGAQIAQVIERSEQVLLQHKPDRLLILGDVNTGYSAVVAARLGIPVFHMEAGNRCYDDRVPEEINRRVIDHSSTILMPYTERAMENLVREGIERERIFITGNPIFEVLEHYREDIDRSDVLQRLGVSAGSYFLVTMHRSENVDEAGRVTSLLTALSAVADEYALPMIVSVHPRTANKLEQFSLTPDSERVKLMPAMGFFDFVRLEKNARVVLSDSGTVQEECSIFGVPNVTIRDVTERPETIECGSNILSGPHVEDVLRAVRTALALGSDWTPPVEYTAAKVARTVAKIVVGYHSLRRHHTGIAD
jgi:UDP-N-acetylglucosamine 2-epimerase (non-hydrolysing)